MTSTFTTVTPVVERDQWGRPRITPPGGGTKIAYTRATTVAGAIDDLNGLIKWKVGRALCGIVDRPDLLLAAAAHRDDKKELYRICDQALEAGGQSASATVGTALHTFTERVNRGQPTGTVPAAYEADVYAYTAATRDVEPVHVEEMVVLDGLQIAGTPDMIAHYRGDTYICDSKTGGINYPHKMAAQLAIYAHGQLYNHDTGQRTAINVNRNRGIIVHLPAGTGRCELHWINIAAGWEAVQLALQVREWRKRPGLLTPIVDDSDGFETAAANLEPLTDRDPILTEIDAAQNLEELRAVWVQHQKQWIDTYTAYAVRRREEITGKTRD